VISSSQRPLPYNTQHSQQTDIHVPSGIRTHNLSRPAAADPRLKPRGHWDRPKDIKFCIEFREIPWAVARWTRSQWKVFLPATQVSSASFILSILYVYIHLHLYTSLVTRTNGRSLENLGKSNVLSEMGSTEKRPLGRNGRRW